MPNITVKFYGKMFIFKDFKSIFFAFSKCSHWRLIFMNASNTRSNVNVTEKSGLISKRIKSKVFQNKSTEVLNSTWQGVNLKQRVQGEHVVNGHFDWLYSWQTCTTFINYYQRSSIKVCAPMKLLKTLFQ